MTLIGKIILFIPWETTSRTTQSGSLKDRRLAQRADLFSPVLNKDKIFCDLIEIAMSKLDKSDTDTATTATGTAAAASCVPLMKPT